MPAVLLKTSFGPLDFGNFTLKYGLREGLVLVDIR